MPPEVVEGLWTYLDDILHSRKLHNVLSQGKTISLRLTVAQVPVLKFRKNFTPTVVLYYSITTRIIIIILMIIYCLDFFFFSEDKKICKNEH